MRYLLILIPLFAFGVCQEVDPTKPVYQRDGRHWYGPKKYDEVTLKQTSFEEKLKEVI